MPFCIQITGGVVDLTGWGVRISHTRTYRLEVHVQHRTDSAKVVTGDSGLRTQNSMVATMADAAHASLDRKKERCSQKSSSNPNLDTMIRSSGLILRRHGHRLVSSRHSGVLSLYKTTREQLQHNPLVVRGESHLRMLSSNAGGEEKKNADDKGESTENEIVLTPGQKVVAATRLTMWLGIAVFATGCAYFIAKELIPTYVSSECIHV
jgi:hypothetical protein